LIIPGDIEEKINISTSMVYRKILFARGEAWMICGDWHLDEI